MVASPKPALSKKKVVLLYHVPSEKGGTIVRYLRAQKIPYREVRLFQKGYRLPALTRVRALVVMGGPMNVYEEDRFPFLKEEDRYIRQAVRYKIPFLGVCLGSQLLAKALGAKVYKASKPEIGWKNVSLADASKSGIFSDHSHRTLKVLQWHEDTFGLPGGARLLASSRVVRHQAFEIQGLFYGLQFHVEITRPMLERWFRKKSDLREILREYDIYRPRLEKTARKIYERFFELKKGL